MDKYGRTHETLKNQMYGGHEDSSTESANNTKRQNIQNLSFDDRNNH